MGDLCVLAASLLHQGQMPNEFLARMALETEITLSASRQTDQSCNLRLDAADRAEPLQLEFSSTAALPQIDYSRADIATSTHLESITKSAKPQPASSLITGRRETRPHSRREQEGNRTFPTSAASLGSSEVWSRVLNDVQPYLPPLRPASNGQLFRQRVAALQAGQTYTRLPTDSFRTAWQGSTEQPTYEQWVALLNQEAHAMGMGQGSNRLSVLLGDSISHWFPTDYYSRDRFWLNQGISGDTTSGILQRLSALDSTHPDRIYLMAGINDLRRGIAEPVVVENLRQIVLHLQAAHPTAQIVLHSILPTQLAEIPAERIQWINQRLRAIAQQTGIEYLDLTAYFADNNQRLDPTLTTDGLHLSPRGYQIWEWAMRSLDATRPALTAQYSERQISGL